MSGATNPDAPALTSTGNVQLQGLTLWMCGILLALANFVAILDTSIANVSVPNIAGALGVSTSQGTWVITSYAVAEAIAVPLTGWLAARFGTVRTFSVALIGFGISSLMCGLSPNFHILVFARIIQGFCGGPLMPLSQTLLLTIFPKKLQPAAMAIWAITTLLGPIAGPVLGGTLCDNLGWGSIFLVNVPIAIGAGFLVWRVLFSQETKTVKARVDTVGLGLLVLWVGALQIMLDLGKDRDWFASPLIVGLAITALLGFIAFVIWELTDSNPIVDLRIFRYRGFTLAMVCLALMIGSFFAINVIAPLWMQTNLGWTATSAGNATGLIGILAIVAAPIASQLTAKVDPRRLIFFGVMWLALITFMRSHADTGMSYSEIAIWIFLAGAGMPFFFMPLIAISMGAVKPEETASASGLQNFIRSMAGAVATSFVTTAWSNASNATHTKLAPLIDLSNLPAALQNGSASALASVDQLLQTQSVMIATNQIFMGAAIVFVFCAFLAWTLPKPSGPVDLSSVH
ncbi:DHA2 family efflux MFS transporter permease subunit [Asticcacaulis sp. EMRT-3]|uniref:DHA2 family efflux MFS transporter permease subunit n=1 Tax=Asticcacaulis sp. EMRT-3 TaxID=3040349 RepID=UPI0024AEDDCB|nr:DHA2 family efflux MFS transporter permease subunit [Asticcacaulis sp. EMRT-3]MDI7776086.1 DHA2 family efflux MFS transporter permease subunit [Asticcacaulis sp. EMRT-3]